MRRDNQRVLRSVIMASSLKSLRLLLLLAFIVATNVGLASSQQPTSVSPDRKHIMLERYGEISEVSQTCLGLHVEQIRPRRRPGNMGLLCDVAPMGSTRPEHAALV
jgi:hypothetical protein